MKKINFFKKRKQSEAWEKEENNNKPSINCKDIVNGEGEILTNEAKILSETDTNKNIDIMKDFASVIKSDNGATIGLIGNYGVGKSTFIQTIKTRIQNNYYDENRRRKNIDFIEISVLKFTGKSNANNISNSSEQDSISNYGIKEIIIQQLMSSFSKNYSNYNGCWLKARLYVFTNQFKRYKINKKWKVEKFYTPPCLLKLAEFLSAFIIISTLTIILIRLLNFTLPEDVQLFKNINNDFYRYFTKLGVIYIIIYSATFLLSGRISRIKIYNIEIEERKIDNPNYFNTQSELIISILRQIRKPKRTVIVIEDIDRIESNEILLEFYEYSKFLKNSGMKFVFLLSDENMAISTSEISKYFDRIYDLIPFMDRYNFKEYVQKNLDKTSKKYIDEKFLNYLGSYCSDVRIVNRILNNYLTLSKSNLAYLKESNSNYKKIFAICFVKTLYPEYVKLSGFDNLNNENLLDYYFNFENRFFTRECIDEYNKSVEIKISDAGHLVLQYLLNNNYIDRLYVNILTSNNTQLTVDDFSYIKEYNSQELTDKSQTLNVSSPDVIFTDFIEFDDMEAKYFCNTSIFKHILNSDKSEIYNKNKMFREVQNDQDNFGFLEQFFKTNSYDLINADLILPYDTVIGFSENMFDEFEVNVETNQNLAQFFVDKINTCIDYEKEMIEHNELRDRLSKHFEFVEDEKLYEFCTKTDYTIEKLSYIQDENYLLKIINENLYEIKSENIEIILDRDETDKKKLIDFIIYKEKYEEYQSVLSKTNAEIDNYYLNTYIGVESPHGNVNKEFIRELIKKNGVFIEKISLLDNSDIDNETYIEICKKTKYEMNLGNILEFEYKISNYLELVDINFNNSNIYKDLLKINHDEVQNNLNNNEIYDYILIKSIEVYSDSEYEELIEMIGEHKIELKSELSEYYSDESLDKMYKRYIKIQKNLSHDTLTSKHILNTKNVELIKEYINSVHKYNRIFDNLDDVDELNMKLIIEKKLYIENISNLKIIWDYFGQDYNFTVSNATYDSIDNLTNEQISEIKKSAEFVKTIAKVLFIDEEASYNDELLLEETIDLNKLDLDEETTSRILKTKVKMVIPNKKNAEKLEKFNNTKILENFITAHQAKLKDNEIKFKNLEHCSTELLNIINKNKLFNIRLKEIKVLFENRLELNELNEFNVQDIDSSVFFEDILIEEVNEELLEFVYTRIITQENIYHQYFDMLDEYKKTIKISKIAINIAITNNVIAITNYISDPIISFEYIMEKENDSELLNLVDKCNENTLSRIEDIKLNSLLENIKNSEIKLLLISKIKKVKLSYNDKMNLSFEMIEVCKTNNILSDNELVYAYTDVLKDKNLNNLSMIVKTRFQLMKAQDVVLDENIDVAKEHIKLCNLEQIIDYLSKNKFNFKSNILELLECSSNQVMTTFLYKRLKQKSVRRKNTFASVEESKVESFLYLLQSENIISGYNVNSIYY